MLIVLLLFAAIVLFFIGVVWPRRARRIERQADAKLRPIEKWAEGLPKPLSFIVKGPFWSSRKTAEFSTEKGREAHRKLH